MHRKLHLKSVEIDIPKVIKEHKLGIGGEVQVYVDSNVLKYCEPLVPKDSNALIESGIQNTQIGSGEVVYNTPYARRWYYMPAHFQEAPQRGNYWFERMKKEYKQSILEGAAKIAGAKAE